MSNAMKTLVFIISLIAYFIYLSISSAFINTMINPENLLLLYISVNVSAIIGILVLLYAQAAVKYWYASRALKDAQIMVTLTLDKFRLVDRLLVYILPSLAIFAPLIQTRSLSSITLDAVLFVVIVIAMIEGLFYMNNKTMKAYITNKGIVVRGIDLRLEIPMPSNYRNPSGFFPYEKIYHFLDLNDKLILEQSYDLGNIIFTGNSETLKQAKAALLANKVRQKKF